MLKYQQLSCTQSHRILIIDSMHTVKIDELMLMSMLYDHLTSYQIQILNLIVFNILTTGHRLPTTGITATHHRTYSTIHIIFDLVDRTWMHGCRNKTAVPSQSVSITPPSYHRSAGQDSHYRQKMTFCCYFGKIKRNFRRKDNQYRDDSSMEALVGDQEHMNIPPPLLLPEQPLKPIFTDPKQIEEEPQLRVRLVGKNIFFLLNNILNLFFIFRMFRLRRIRHQWRPPFLFVF